MSRESRDSMTVVHLEVAESVLAALRLSREEFGPALRLAAARHWYSRGGLS